MFHSTNNRNQPGMLAPPEQLFTFNSLHLPHPHPRRNFLIRSAPRKDPPRPATLQAQRTPLPPNEEPLEDFPTFKNLRVSETPLDVQDAPGYMLLVRPRQINSEATSRKAKAERYGQARKEKQGKEQGKGMDGEDASENFDLTLRNLTPIEELGAGSRRRAKRSFSQKRGPRMVYPVSDRKLPQVFKRAWVDPALQVRLSGKAPEECTHSLELGQLREGSRKGAVLRRLSAMAEGEEWTSRS